MKHKFSIPILISIVILTIVLVITRIQPSLNSPSPGEINYSPLPDKLNSWFASAYSFPSNYIHALPAMYRLSQDGIIFSQHKPESHSQAIVTTIGDDCTLKFDEPIQSTKVSNYSDWSVQIDFAGSNLLGSLYLVQGMPVAYINTNQQALEVICPGANYDTSEGDTLISHHDKHYLLEENSHTIGNYRLSILPSLSHLELFRSNPWQIISNTSITWEAISNEYSTLYSFRDAKEPLLFTIWPHHTSYTHELEVLGTYRTALGDLNLVQEQSFETRIPQPNLPTSFQAVTNPMYKQSIIKAVKKDVNRYASQELTGGVYFRGTQLGSLATLLNLTKIYDLEEESQIITDLLIKELTLSLSKINYNSSLSSMISSEAEFGNENGNDHHFHYGYYIRAAATLCMYQPELINTFEDKIRDLILDIANLDYSETRFPYLRHYSTYEGHSWADGRADFADGNNQESTSEALNAWYAIYLWGEVTNNHDIKDRGAWLFSQELVGTRAYWFGYNNPFPDSYKHSFASIVWSSKRDFATWFSADPIHILGIQLLPITPASNYLSQLNYSSVNQDITSLSNNIATHEWGDLYTILESYHDSDHALANLPKVISFAGTKLESLLLQVIYSAQK